MVFRFLSSHTLGHAVTPGISLVFEGTVSRIPGNANALGALPLPAVAQRLLKYFQEQDSFEGVEGQYWVCVVQAGRLVAYRSRLCPTSLYYSDRYISNTLALAACAGPYVDEAYFLRYLVDMPSLQYRSDFSPLRGVQRLAPGCLLEAEKGQTRLFPDAHRVYHFKDLPYQPIHGLAYEVRSKLSQIINEHAQRNGGRLVCELSGGLDSSFVTCLAAQAGVPVSAYMYSYPQNPSHHQSESFARQVAQQYGISLRVITPAELPEVDLADRLPYQEEPADFFWQGALFGPVVAKWAGPNTTILSGFGSDQLFMRQPCALLSWLKRGAYRRFSRSVQDMAKASDRSALHFILQSALGLVPRRRFLQLTNHLQGSRLNPFAVDEVCPELNLLRPIHWLRHTSEDSLLDFIEEGERLDALDFEAAVPHADLAYLAAPDYVMGPHFRSARISYAHPFCDARLIDFVFNEVSMHWIHNWSKPYKYLLREAQVGIVPEALRNRTKNEFCFDGFFYSMLRKNRDTVFQLLSDLTRGQLGLFLDVNEIESALEELLFGMGNATAQRICRLLAYSIWWRDFCSHAPELVAQSKDLVPGKPQMRLVVDSRYHDSVRL